MLLSFEIWGEVLNFWCAVKLTGLSKCLTWKTSCLEAFFTQFSTNLRQQCSAVQPSLDGHGSEQLLALCCIKISWVLRTQYKQPASLRTDDDAQEHQRYTAERRVGCGAYPSADFSYSSNTLRTSACSRPTSCRLSRWSNVWKNT